jgi:hypothetical protein
VNTIKKFKIIKNLIILFFFTLFSTPCLTLDEKIERDIFIGCYSNSKQYIGSERAQEYCICTIEMLGKKFNDKEIEDLFKKESQIIMKETEFAAIHCDKNKKAF